MLAACVLLLHACTALDPHHLLSRATGPDPRPLDAQARESTFDDVWRRVGEGYYDPAMHGLDWAATAARHRARALSAADDDAYWSALDHMLGELRDSHTRIEGPREVAARESLSDTGLALRWLDGQLWVERAEPDGAAAAAGVRRGQRLLQVDGRDAVAGWEAAWAARRGGSTPQAQALRAQALWQLQWPAPEVALQLLRPDGTVFTTVLDRRHRPTALPASASLLPGGVLLLRMSRFTQEAGSVLQAALAEHRNATGLVLDLRGNPGGSMQVMRRLADELLREPALIGRSLTRKGAPMTLFFGLWEVVPGELRLAGRGDAAYSGPVVVLVDRATASAAELLAATLQQLGRATVVGETSCGCVLGFLGYFPLAGGARLAFSEVGFAPARGGRIEGRGVVPELALPVTPQALTAAGDPTLEAALARLR